jgi:hypothetical protein
MKPEWTPTQSDPSWAAEPTGQLLVRTSAVASGELLESVLIELIAHEASDELLGSLVRLILEPKLEALREKGAGQWTRVDGMRVVLPVYDE